LQKQNEIQKAQKNYDEIIDKTDLNSLKAESNYNKALAFLKEKDLLQAINSFEESLKENPADDDARENLQKAINELKKQQSKPQNQKQQQQQKNPDQQKQPPLNKEMMQQKFNELRNQEKQLQQKLQNKNNTTQPEKDW
jgi:tetratricopeptide (TPR) repeat protein